MTDSNRRPARGGPADLRFNSRSRVGSDAPEAFNHDLVQVSIHAPAWGATRRRPSATRVSAVSIHAPAWGATPRRRRGRGEDGGFNSRSRMGSDATPPNPPPSTNKFQFTLPHGERRNSAQSAALDQQVSIHAPAWGATTIIEAEGVLRQVSIHAPAWGATEGVRAFEKAAGVSIHAPAWGATHPCAAKGVTRKFQFTLPHGERQ